MPAKKTASRKRAPAKVSRKKASKRKPVSRKKSSGSKRKVSKKKVSRKKVSARKKPAAKKKVSKKKAASKKASKKKATRSVSRKKVARKKAASKKATSRKATSRKKPASRKKASAKRPSAKKPAARKAAPARPAPVRSANDVLSGPIHGIEPYKAKRGEEYMSPDQLAHFQAILQSWKRELMNHVDETVHHMQDEAANFPDPNDRATQESEFGLELRTRDRERKLLRKINSALVRIDEGTYGYCTETGEEIGLKRLEARPVATLCLEAQERREKAERQFRDMDDRYR